MGHACSSLDYSKRVNTFPIPSRPQSNLELSLFWRTFEDRLRFGGERKGSLKWILDAIFSQDFEELGRTGVRIDHDVGIGNLDTKSVGGEIFSVLGSRET